MHGKVVLPSGQAMLSQELQPISISEDAMGDKTKGKIIDAAIGTIID